MMIYKPRRRCGAVLFTAAGTLTAFCLALSVTGCGSGGGTASPMQLPVSDPAAVGAITRAMEDTLTTDAKILALRETTGTYVSLAAARAFDADLTRIRAEHFEVHNVRAKFSYAQKTLFVLVRSRAEWIKKWDTSASASRETIDTDLTTGEPALDALLKKYDATRTVDAQYQANGRSFTLRFAATLNMPHVAAELARSSPNIIVAEATPVIGIVNNLTYAPGTNGNKIYTFSQGYGDCESGCINQYIHRYTLSPDGSISEEIKGTSPVSGTVAEVP